MSAVISQINGFIPFTPNLNPVTVKIGNAKIILDGLVQAGTNFTAKTDLEVFIDVSNAILSAAYVPVAVNIALTESSIRVGEDGSVKAGGSATLKANSDITIVTRATSGALPISLAVSVAVVDAFVETLGDIIASAGNVLLSADGKLSMTTISSSKADETVITTGTPNGDGTSTGMSGNKFGGFFAISVALQNVWAKVLGDANITAGGDVTVSSHAEERAATRGMSADAMSSGAKIATSQTLNQIIQISLSTLGKVGDFVKSPSAAEKLQMAEDKIVATEGRQITVKMTQNGAVTAANRVKAGETANVKVTPNEGYKLSGMTISYLPAGSASYVTKDVMLSDGKYTFVMPDADVTIIANFVKLAPGETAPVIDSSVYGEDEDDSANAKDVFDNATGDNGRVTTPENPGSAYQLKANTYKDKDGKVVGAVVPEATASDAGNDIVIVVNPAEGMQLKEGSLIARYTLGDKVISYTMVKNSAGQYVLTMPAANVVFLAEFEEAPAVSSGTAQSAAGSSSSTGGIQATGALAVGVGINHNEAVIDTTGRIKAGGALSVDADAITQSSILADGSPVSDATVKNVGTKTDDDESGSAGGGEITAEQKTQVVITEDNMHSVHDVTIAATANGSVKSNSDTEFSFTVTPRQGYLLDTITISFLNMQGATITYQLDKVGNVYTLDPTHGKKVPAGMNVTINATFKADSYKITASGDTAGIQLPASANAGDTVTITIGDEISADQTITISGNDITVTKGDNGKFTFVMPGKDVANTVTRGNKANEIKVASAAASLRRKEQRQALYHQGEGRRSDWPRSGT